MLKKIGIGCGGIIGLFVLLTVVLAIAGSSSSKHSPSETIASAPTTTAHSTKTAKAPRKTKPRPRFTEYAGLGSTIADFKHDNTMFCLNCALQPGEAAYNIKGQHDGRVTAYQVSEAFKPAAGDALRLSLVAGTMIPGAITAPVRQTPTCEDWRVPQLKKLIGVEYAEASTAPDSNMAYMQAVKAPTC